jgi:polyhydroxybutyrate depolymerase
MIKAASQFSYALIFTLLCSCSAASPPKLNGLSGETAPNPSMGCGIAQQGSFKLNGKFVSIKTQVLGQERKYHLRLPRFYDPNRAYPLIFRWHGAGGNGLSGGLGIEFSARDSAIIVSADGLNNFWQIYADSADLPFFDNMLESISNQYCVDRNRVFSFGFSAGGTFSNLLACERSDVLRASAAIASGITTNTCKGKVATWLLHDRNDDAVLIAEGEAARERAIAVNGCSTSTVDEGNGCVRYQGCDAAPVVWCESKGFGHNIRGDFAPAQVWKFFQSLD